MLFAKPLWLILLIIIPVIWITYRHKKVFIKLSNNKVINDSSKRNYVLFILVLMRILSVLFVIISLAELSVFLPSRKNKMVLLFDVSESLGRDQVERSRKSALALLKRVRAGDEISIVSFSGEPVLVAGWTKAKEIRPVLESVQFETVNGGETDISRAIRFCNDLFKDQYGNHMIVMFTDGRINKGDNISETLTKNNHIPVYTVPVGVKVKYLFTKSLKIPDLVRIGQKINIKWILETPVNENIFVTVKTDDKIYEKNEFRLLKGENAIDLPLSLTSAGMHKFEIEVYDSEGNSFTYADTGAYIFVSGPLKTLLVSDRNSGYLVNALRTQGIDAVKIGIENMSDSPLELSRYNSIIFDNVPGQLIGIKQQKALLEYVSGGGGLFVIGGDRSFGRGEYYNTKLEEILPVQTDTRQRILFTKAYILFIIDQSGSMLETVNGVSKKQIAMKSIAESVKELNSTDKIAIMGFSTKTSWILPFTNVSESNIIDKALEDRNIEGGTELYKAMSLASESFTEQGPFRRHAIIITDGWTLKGDFEGISKQLHSLDVTVSTIGVGDDVNEELLGNIAGWTEGKYYRAQTEQIPQIILKETIRVTRDQMQEGQFYPSIKYKSMLIDEAAEKYPVKGYLITKAKPLSTIHLSVGENDPLLAESRYGNGRVMAFTSDSGARWLSSWLNAPFYNKFWSQIIRYIEQENFNKNLRIQAQVQNQTADITVEALNPDRSLRTGLQLMAVPEDSQDKPVMLKEKSPGFYQAVFNLKKTGLQYFKIINRHNNEWSSAWVYMQHGSEYRNLGPDLSMLSYISNSTNAKVLSLNKPVINFKNYSWESFSLKYLLLALALIIFVFELGYRSTFLGQMKMMKILLLGWIMLQRNIIDKIFNRTGKNRDKFYSDHNRILDAYQYLAKRSRDK